MVKELTEIKYRVKKSRYWIIESDIFNYSTDENGNITSITNGSDDISVGDIIDDECDLIKVNEIVRENRSLSSGEHIEEYRLIYSRLTKASQFLMPIIGMNKKYWLFDQAMINCFVDIEEMKIEVLYRFNDLETDLSIDEITQKSEAHELFDTCYHYDDYSIIFSFNIPMENHFDVYKFFEGKYSEMSTELKRDILKFNNASKRSILNKVLSKEEDYRKHLEDDLMTSIPSGTELLDVPKREKEILNLIDNLYIDYE